MRPSCFLSLDFGTSSKRVVAFDVQGELLWQASDPSSLECGGVEGCLLDPAGVRSSMLRLLRLAASALSSDNVIGLGISAQLGMVVLDTDGNPLAPVTTWRDRSAVEEAAILTRELGTGWVYRTTGRRVDPELGACKLLQLKRRAPGVFGRIRWVLTLKDYLVYLLTGACVVDPAHASYTMLADVAGVEWSAELVRAVGITTEQLPPIFPGTACAGVLTPAAAGETGLPQGLPVAVGGPDGTVGAVGAGMVRAGSGVDVMGTSDVLLVATDRPRFHPHEATLVNAHVLPGLWAAGGPMTTTGGALQWLAENILGDTPDQVDARLAALEDAARDLPPGADELLGIPSLVGERAPLWDPRMRGAFVGLGPQHRTAHLYRALVEGATFLLAIHLEALREAGVTIDTLILAGGGSRSRLACQIRSDVFGRAVSVCPVSQTTALGAAILAAAASGYYPGASEASGAMGKQGEALALTPGHHARYQEHLARFRILHSTLRALNA